MVVQNTTAVLLIWLTAHDQMERKAEEMWSSLMKSCIQVLWKLRAGIADRVINKEFPEVNIPGKRVSSLEAEHRRVEVRMTCAPLSWNVLLLGHWSSLLWQGTTLGLLIFNDIKTCISTGSRIERPETRGKTKERPAVNMKGSKDCGANPGTNTAPEQYEIHSFMDQMDQAWSSALVG